MKSAELTKNRHQRHASSSSSPPPPAAGAPPTCTCHHLAPLGGLGCQLVGDVDHLLLLLYGDLLFVLVVWAQSQTGQHVLHAGGAQQETQRSVVQQDVFVLNKTQSEFRAKLLPGGRDWEQATGEVVSAISRV